MEFKRLIKTTLAPYFCTVNVRLTTPLETIEDSGAFGFLVGYYRNIGVRAAGISELKTVLNKFVRDGAIMWDDSVVHDFESVDENIVEQFNERGTNVVWYVSGRIFYPGSVDVN